MVPRGNPQRIEEYAIGWIAGLPITKAAAITMLDERYDPPENFAQHPSDGNSYTWGRMSNHNLVIASLPSCNGMVSATKTASNMMASLPNIKLGLVVEIGAGIPSVAHDLRLGDVVIGQPRGTSPGVVQYDLGKVKQGRSWELNGILPPPAMAWQHAMTSLQAEHLLEDSKIHLFLNSAAERYPKWSSNIKPPSSQDRLFQAAYIHPHETGTDCSKCDPKYLQDRSVRDPSEVKIFYGTIASGNSLVKDAHTRDEIGARVAANCCCLEMEAAGIMDVLPCVVLQGICNYADSHKNDLWQGYAASTAAACGKELLLHTRALGSLVIPEIVDVLNPLKTELAAIQTYLRNIRESRQEMTATEFLQHYMRTNMQPEKIETKTAQKGRVTGPKSIRYSETTSQHTE